MSITFTSIGQDENAINEIIPATDAMALYDLRLELQQRTGIEHQRFTLIVPAGEGTELLNELATVAELRAGPEQLESAITVIVNDVPQVKSGAGPCGGEGIAYIDCSAALFIRCDDEGLYCVNAPYNERFYRYMDGRCVMLVKPRDDPDMPTGVYIFDMPVDKPTDMDSLVEGQDYVSFEEHSTLYLRYLECSFHEPVIIMR